MTELADVSLAPADAKPFKPSDAQALAKEHLRARLAEVKDIRPVESLSLDELCEFARSRHMKAWLRNPKFAEWVFDQDVVPRRIAAMRELVVDTLWDVLVAEYIPKVLTAKDKLKAADMLLQLNSMYPAKATVKFLDRDLDAMDEHEVDRQLTSVKARLSLPPK